MLVKTAATAALAGPFLWRAAWAEDPALTLQNKEATLAVLHQLRALGIRIALDDFGTG